MRPVQKVLTTMLWGCAVLALVSVIGANLMRDRTGGGGGSGSVAGAGGGGAEGEGDGALQIVREAPAFSLVDQNDEPVTLETLKGKPFIANFIFTHCAGPCPVMTRKMLALQKSVPAGVKLISFTVDPTQDRPDVLKEYAKIHDADNARWHFLTVADPANASASYAVARGMLLVAQPADETNPIIHDEHFVLVDANGMIRSYYSSKDEHEMEQLKTDASKLLNDDAAGKK
jgi:protein SCO1/2